MNITDFDIESSRDCSWDGLIIANTRNFENDTLAKLCHVNNNLTVITSNGHEMFIQFRSDYTFTGKGFSASYVTKFNSEFKNNRY